MTLSAPENQHKILKKWQFWVDRGGTFTDVVARTPEGRIITRKLLSENPEQYADAALQGIRNILKIKSADVIPHELLESVKMGTTVATNALLERTGTPTVLAITRGFKDALRIAYQNRPKLFELDITLPQLLYQDVVEIEERVSAQGDVLVPFNSTVATEQLKQIFNRGIRAIAIVLMHGYRYHHHEQQLAEIAAEIGFTQISLSHQTSPLMKLVSRGDTTVVDAYLSPILRQYIDQVAAELGGTQLMFMQSNGGLVSADLFQGKDSILSGPAGGIVGAVKTCQQAGYGRIITFDMGGTSTDVAHFQGEYERTFDAQVAGVRIRAPMMQIHTVAAGGGSILSFAGERFRVGPESAGANPGPACYRRGGPLTVTDCNLLLGKLNPDFFPSVFGQNADQPLDSLVVAQKFDQMSHEIEQQTGRKLTPFTIAEGFLKIAVDNMANAIKQISTQRGYDVTDYTLCSFGGAGGQHACLVADALGMKKVILHPFAGVLSAYGMGLADMRTIRQQAVERQLSASLMRALQSNLIEMEIDARNELIQQGVTKQTIQFLRTAYIKYEGTDSSLPIPFQKYEEEYQQIIAAFASAHHQQYGFSVSAKALVLESICVEAMAPGYNEDSTPPTFSNRPDGLSSIAQSCFFSDGQHHTVPVYNRCHLRPGDYIDGPAMVIEDTGTNIVEAGWQAHLSKLGNLMLERVVPLPDRVTIGTQADPIMLEVFNNLFMSIAEQMGAVLENTSASVNVKERLDFSCAIFNDQGDLVANAPHMPIHLGSMGESVKGIIAKFGQEISPGDSFISNAPYNGGTHLPDITVISPVFNLSDSEILFFVASRGHHADIGGISPGSMPPNSVTVEQEGVLFDNIRLIQQGEFSESLIRRLLTTGHYPARNPDQNIADLKAQIAANNKGINEMWRMIKHYGVAVVKAYMQHVQDNAEASVRKVIAGLKEGEFSYQIDDFATIKVKLTLDQVNASAVVDFTGTSAQLPNNFNAPSAVCKAAVLYVFRTLVKEDIPMNQGCLKPIQIIIPSGSMLNPCYPAAVVAGNVETSQWIVNALYGALGVCAAAQGTMNNFTFGDDTYQYYETIAGGMGAGADFDGVSAIQSHMTNSRLTDPEVLEWRFPVLVDDFSIRKNSGGQGKHCGGDGVVRKIRFLEPMSAAILSSHRKTAPFGLAGGQPGARGNNYVQRADGERINLEATAQVSVKGGDTFVIETPGGGGFGLSTEQ
ncbi:MAG: hydantoinase B/oxoprolinase family protein [Pseudomonadales bacterium]|nr:hydantoinase B/oxoprolinase family protein [Pseudomonadales bacterium]